MLGIAGALLGLDAAQSAVPTSPASLPPPRSLQQARDNAIKPGCGGALRLFVRRSEDQASPARTRRSYRQRRDCNIYLHRLDRAWQTRGVGALVRYADDLLVLCRSRREAEHALATLTAILAELGLAPKQAKTRREPNPPV